MPDAGGVNAAGLSVAAAIRAAAARLAGASDTARLDAELLMAHALQMSRSDMLLRAMQAGAPAEFAALVERRAAFEPVAYITGSAEFYGLELSVCSDVLIPRSDSEILVTAALEQVAEAGRVADLGTGSGALLLAFLAHRLHWHGVGVDASAGALAAAAGNAAALGLAQRAAWPLRDWHTPGWADDLGRFDLVLANPPYVEEGALLDAQVRDYEPASALFAGPQGLNDYRVLIPQLPQLLAADGIAIIEIGATQSGAVSGLAEAAGFVCKLACDLAARPRALVLRPANSGP